MPVAFITTKLPDGSLVHLDVELKTRIEEFRSILAPKCGIKRHRQRLVFAGRLMQDGRTLEAYGVERNSTIHLLHGQTAGEQGPGGVDISSIPPQLGALQRHVLQNPDILQQMLESPAMQSLLNDHDFMRSLLKMDPRLTQLLDGCPELQEMLHDSEFMKQSTEAMRNPVHVRDVLRSTDRSMTQLESLAGGAFDVLRTMTEDILRPMQDSPPNAELTASMKTKKPPAPKPAGGDGEGEDGEDPEAEDGQPPVAPEGPQPPEWFGSFDTNAMASMMQDQNMQHLLAQLIQTLPGPTAKPHPDDPFVDSGFIGQMFHSQTVQSMTLLQEAIEKLSMAAEPSESKGDKKEGAAKEDKTKGKKAGAAKAAGAEPTGPATDSSAVLSGLHPTSPAANFKDAFALFLAADQESPEVRYKGQLQAMSNMGFTDREACIQALHSCDGNMNKAVENLMAQQKS